MKSKTRIISCIIFCFLIITKNATAQINLDLSAANAFPLHEIDPSGLDFTDINTFSAQANYVPGKIGLGVQYSFSQFATDENYLDQFSSLTTTLNASREEWVTNFISVGPVLKIGKNKLNLELFPKIGLGLVKSPDRQLVYNIGQEEYILYEDNQGESLGSTEIFSGLDAKLKFNISENIGIHLTSGINSTQFFGSGNSTNYREVNPSGDGVTEEDVTTGRLLQQNCDAFHLLHVGAGISIGLSKKEKEKKKKDFLSPDFNPEKRTLGPDEELCIELSITSPLPSQDFGAGGMERPTFSWTANTSKKLTFRFLLKEINVDAESKASSRTIFETKTSNRYLSWPSKVPWPVDIKMNSKKDFAWSVEVVDSNEKLCNGQAQSVFSILNAQLDVLSKSMDVVCKDPAYNQNGDVCYDITENWSIQNHYTGNANFVSHIVQTHNGSVFTPRTISPIPSFPTLPGGGSITTFSVSYSMCVPLGEVTVESALEYFVPNEMSSPDKFSLNDSLPVCICEACDEWELDIQNQKIEPWVNVNAGQDYIYIEDNLTAIAPAGNIVRVEAEIVQYEHWKEWGSNQPDDPELNQCFTCNTRNGQHGTFVPYANALGNPITNQLSTGFINQDRAYYREAGSSIAPPPSRNIYWRTGTPSGVNMPLTSKLTIGVPNFSNLENCCADELKICIRYSFTAYNPDDETCVVCSEVLCYSIKRDSNTIVKKTTPQTTY